MSPAAVRNLPSTSRRARVARGAQGGQDGAGPVAAGLIAEAAGSLIRTPATARTNAPAAAGTNAAGTVGSTTAGSAGAVVLVALSPPVPVTGAALEPLVDLLATAGWNPVTVIGSVTELDADRGLDDVAALAALAGLHRVDGSDGSDGPDVLKGVMGTETGPVLRINDAHADDVEAPVPQAPVLAGRRVSRAWAEAGYRVVVTRNATDMLDGYRSALATLTGVADAPAGASAADVAADLYDYLPPDLVVVDALVSSHGPAGSWLFDPLPTGTVIAADDALLADTVVAMMQGCDPAAAAPVAAVLARRARTGGPVAAWSIDGDTSPFAGWNGVNPLVRDAAAALSTSRTVRRTLAAAAAEIGSAAQADRVLRMLARLVQPVLTGSGSAAGKDALAAILYALGAATTRARASATVFAKHRTELVDVPLGFDHERLTQADYRAVAAHLAPLETLIAQVPAGEDGLRWTRHEGAVLFETTREVAVPFGDWVARVDAAAGISLMADYLGGRRIPVARDRRGRVTMQAERNLYLPQPNYTAYWGAPPIDVGKIELVEYGDVRQRLLWRTLVSPNGSATVDDGSLTFADSGHGTTLLTVMGRQHFTLPPFLAALDLARFPELDAVLVLDAYRRFFAATFDNLEACYEGRPFRIGRATQDDPLWTANLAPLLDGALEWLGEQVQRPKPPPGLVSMDADGFTHVRTAR